MSRAPRGVVLGALALACALGGAPGLPGGSSWRAPVERTCPRCPQRTTRRYCPACGARVQPKAGQSERT